MKGQIKDHKKERPAAPPAAARRAARAAKDWKAQRHVPGKRDTQRLAGKQAALRNKAEGVEPNSRSPSSTTPTSRS